ncbi:MAG: prepilin-type N-terminal cleavage/methylation domain-containing protein [Candidatus Omnitrophica bacterium]|nr:prepilin-type N-terminal cleavage/methylation domain-containing protein [Candidatus Omnitrophota bacterium]
MNKKSGFSLVEVMIVVAILALLAVIAIPNLRRAKILANESAARSALKTISNSLENYAALNHIYPAATSQLIGADPPYLTKDFFIETYNGYSFTITLTDYTYTITANPINNNTGTLTFTITTGGVLTEI